MLRSQHLPLSQPEPLTRSRLCQGCAAKAGKFRFETHGNSKGEKRRKQGRAPWPRPPLSPTAGTQPARWDLPALRVGWLGLHLPKDHQQERTALHAPQCWDNQGNSDTDCHWQPWERETVALLQDKALLTHAGKRPGAGSLILEGACHGKGGYLLTPTSTWSEPRSSCLWSSSK